MASAKDIIIKPISMSAARSIVKKIHYSGKVTNSQLHFGIFLNGKLEGALQFGPSIDKRKTAGLVKNSLWSEFIELNRMALSDALPKNSESRALSVCIRLIKKHYPQLRYIYFIDKSYKERLTVHVLPFTDIDKMGAGMYKGEAITIQSRRVTQANSDDQLESGGAIPTNTLQSQGV